MSKKLRNNLILLKGDCLVESEKIESGSVDLILTDPPYGTMNGFNGIDWDFAIDPEELLGVADRILRKNGKLVLFSQEPYTSRLINEAIPNLLFSYRMIWEKDSFANGLLANKAPVNYFEDIIVFSKRDCEEYNNPAKEYTNKIRVFINKPNREIFSDFERAGYKKYAVLDTFNSDKARRYLLPTETTYENLIELYGIDSMEGFIEYQELRAIFTGYEGKFKSTFNLWEGGKYKSNILRYKKDYDGYPPTQKPVALLEDLIQTYSNAGDTVVDLTMGSGSTGVAAANTGRKFIGIEKEVKYFEIARNRIADAKAALEL